MDSITDLNEINRHRASHLKTTGAALLLNSPSMTSASPAAGVAATGGIVDKSFISGERAAESALSAALVQGRTAE